MGSLAHAAITLDEFSDQFDGAGFFGSLDVGANSADSSSQTGLSGVFGGERDGTLTQVTGGASSSSGFGFFDLSTDASADATVTLTYGLGGIADLTEGGQNTLFGFIVEFTDLGPGRQIDFVLTIEDEAGDSHTETVRITDVAVGYDVQTFLDIADQLDAQNGPGSGDSARAFADTITAPFPVLFSLGAFTAAGVDLTAADTVSFSIDPVDSLATDTLIGELLFTSFIPAPGVLPLGAGSLALGLRRRR
ncbi:MAG: hypothetical protein AAGI30_10905 [Planctomycetota bacterium]